MKKIVEVKDLKIGEGKPKLCVPLVGTTDEELLNEVKVLRDLNYDLVEWRVDYYGDVENIERVKTILVRLRSQLKQVPILFTCRSHHEGGLKEISVEYYVHLVKEIIATTLIDLVDVELCMGDEMVAELVRVAHAFEVKVMMSNHDFLKTPPQREIINRLCHMQDLNADLLKIAVMPQSCQDVLTLLAATEEMVGQHTKAPIVTVSMGRLGIVSRIAGETFGSAITFGAAQKESAPGQIKVDDLSFILDVLHKSQTL